MGARLPRSSRSSAVLFTPQRRNFVEIAGLPETGKRNSASNISSLNITMPMKQFSNYTFCASSRVRKATNSLLIAVLSLHLYNCTLTRVHLRTGDINIDETPIRSNIENRQLHVCNGLNWRPQKFNHKFHAPNQNNTMSDKFSSRSIGTLGIYVHVQTYSSF